MLRCCHDRQVNLPECTSRAYEIVKLDAISEFLYTLTKTCDVPFLRVLTNYEAVGNIVEVLSKINAKQSRYKAPRRRQKRK